MEKGVIQRVIHCGAKNARYLWGTTLGKMNNPIGAIQIFFMDDAVPDVA
jgi:hypothetical protein